MSTPIVLASNNKDKLSEFKQLFSNTGITIVSQQQFKVSEIAETHLTFVENAILKARHACEQTGLAAIADDSGLEVDALNGAPGILSARYAGEKASYANNIAKLLNELQTIPEIERTARFQCLLVYLRSANDPTPIICQGTLEGIITSKTTGMNGFGYDPIFFVPEYNKTVAELDPKIKNQISHRGQALRELVKKLCKK